MAQIRDTDIIKTPPVTIDPRLFVPVDVIDMTVKSPEIDPENAADSVDNQLELTGEEGDIIYDTGVDLNVPEADNVTLPTPSFVTIESQTIRFAPDGRAVVDVVINVEDIAGIDNYDVRTTKG